MDEPLYRVCVDRRGAAARPGIKSHAGHWVAEDAWPSPRIDWQTFHLNANRLAKEPQPGAARLRCARPPRPAPIAAAGAAMAATSPDLAIDQRREDGQALSSIPSP